MKTPIWPYIAVVACLFVLSLLAPRAWLTGEPHAPPPLATANVTTPTLLHVRTEQEFDTREHAVHGSGDALVSSDAGPVTDSLAVKLDESLPELDVLFGPENAPQIAPIQPPVGEQIRLDVSVTETPALPLAAPANSPSPPQEAAPVSQPQSPVPAQETPVVMEKRTAKLPEVAGVIPRPSEIIDALYELTSEPHCADWAREVSSLLEKIHQEQTLESPAISTLFHQLFRQLRETPKLADATKSFDLRAKLLRLGYAAKRRLDIWYQVHRILTQTTTPVSNIDSGMKQRLADVEKRLTEAAHANDWRQYLLLDEVRRMTGPADPAARREIAKRVLKRIDSPRLTEAQVAVFQKSPFEDFSLELRRWANEPIDYLRLLDQIEEYERTGSRVNSAAIATCYDTVRWSPEPELQKLGELLNTHYRNANVRVALTSEFLNRLLPDPQAYQQNINDTIAGADVHGTSHTVNRLHVVLHPDSETWRIGLEAHGEVASDTAASKGPATFYNQGFSRYHARKLLMIDRRGIRVWRAEADANSESELTGFETDFDPIPIVGWLARSVARSQHDQQYSNAKAETEEMVRSQATSRFDEEVHSRLAAAEQKVKQKFLLPFEKIDLKPTPLDMSTTEQRVIARYRFAGDSQLGAQTPRPQAPSDSLLSVQIHESALNNTLANLKLEGKRIGLRELYRELLDIFELHDVEVPDDIPENVTIRFADKEAVHVRCDDSHIMLTLRIAELKSGRSGKYTDFAVRAYYVPDTNQLNANLVREDTLQIIGVGLRERLPLRTIFAAVLAKKRPFNLINKQLSENPHLHDCHVNQFVINDGWVGVGVGPNRADQLDQFAKQRVTDQQR